MNNNEDETKAIGHPVGRILEIVSVTNEDMARALMIPSEGCPRRYCWWWRSLSFEWEITPSEGCTWLHAEKPAHWRFTDTPCCRADPSSLIDHFEPRGPHIESDGIDASAWMSAREDNHKEHP
jgi:hypothetical protein